MPKDKSKLHCLCRKPAEGFMIKCDGCKDWFHGPCVRITLISSRKLCKWYCSHCSLLIRFKKLEEELNERLLEVKVETEKAVMEKLRAELLEKNNCHQDQIDQDRQHNLQDDTETLSVVEKETRDSMTIIEPEPSLYEQNLFLKETNKHLIIALCQAAKDERALRQSAKESSAQMELLQSGINSLSDQIKGLKNRGRLSLKKK